MQVSGIGENAAVLLNLVPAAQRCARRSVSAERILNSVERCGAYFMDLLDGQRRELLDIAGVLTASRRVADYDAQRQGEETVLDRLFTSLHTNKYLEEQIRSAILDEETIADTASSELADIRRKMRRRRPMPRSCRRP